MAWNAHDEFIRNTTGWLTFFTTTTLGVTTAYFAWRTRQMQRAQLRQSNRQADLELADAEAELNNGLLAPFYWNSWKENSDAFGALTVYGDAKDKLRRPDLPKVVRILGFYLPDAEKDASEGIIRLYATLDFLNVLVPRLARPRDGIAAELDRAEHGLQQADAQMKRSLEAIKRKREELRHV
jgi:hypothetical protein